MSNEDWNELDESYRSALSGALETAHPAVEQAGGDERATLAHRSEFHQHLKECADEVATWPSYKREALTQPSPAQAEVERPEVVAYADPVAFATFKERGHEGGVAGREWMWAEPGAALVAMSRTDECERIVGALREQYECNTAIMHARTEALSRVTSERDAALSRVAELEKQEPVATVAKVPGEDWNSLDFHRDLQDMQPGTKLYAAPVAQAQHSVPEGWMLVECGIWTQEQVDEMQKTVTRFRNSEFVDDRALAMAVADAGQCKAPEISLAELLAAAPGKEGV